MKNSKRTTYLLLALVVGIWGYVIYRIFSKVGDEQPIPVAAAAKTPIDENLRYYRSPDSLRNDSVQRSPFIGIAEAAPAIETAAEQPEAMPQQEVYDPMAYAPAMDVQYLGFIQNEKHKQPIAILQVNGKQHYLHAGEQLEGIRLLQVGAHSIKIKTDYQTLTIDKR